MALISARTLSMVRLLTLAATGLVCLVYAVLALVLGRPDPFSSWIPVLFGLGSALAIMISAFAAGDRNASIATDELYFAENRKAQGFGFWIALLLYPAFGFLLGNGVVSFPVAFAAMGTLTAAAYLLSFTVLDLQSNR